MINSLASFNSNLSDFPEGFYRDSQTMINTDSTIKHFKIKSGKDFSLIALQKISVEDFGRQKQFYTGLYKMTSNFVLDRLIYSFCCKNYGQQQYCKISKKLEDFFLIIYSNLRLIHYNIPKSEEHEIKAKNDYQIEGLKLADNQSIIVLLLRSKVKKDIEIELRSISNSKVLLKVYILCTDWNLKYFSLQKIDPNNMIGVTMEQHCMNRSQIYIKHIINKKIVKIQIINTFKKHLVDSKLYTLQGIDYNFQLNDSSKEFKLQTIMNQKILRQLCIRKFEFYKVIDKRIIVVCECIGFRRFRIFRYDIKTGNQIDFCQNDRNFQKFKLEMNKLSLCKYIWQSKNYDQDQDSMINLQKNG